MRLLNMQWPQVKHLLAALASVNPEAFVFISDGHEGVSQINMYDGLVSEKLLGDYGYVLDPKDKRRPGEDFPADRTIPAIQIDTGC